MHAHIHPIRIHPLQTADHPWSPLRCISFPLLLFSPQLTTSPSLLVCTALFALPTPMHTSYMLPHHPSAHSPSPSRRRQRAVRGLRRPCGVAAALHHHLPRRVRDLQEASAGGQGGLGGQSAGGGQAVQRVRGGWEGCGVRRAQRQDRDGAGMPGVREDVLQ